MYPKPPEFERTSTTLVNAYVGPPIVRYLDRLEARLRDAGYTSELLDRDVGRRRRDARRDRQPRGRDDRLRARPAASSPRPRAATAAGLGDVVSVDMGGTSYDVCLIRDGRPELNSDWNWRHRYCIALPMVDIHVDRRRRRLDRARSTAARCTVGPESAGSRARARSATGAAAREPTVTDADLVLGRLDPDAFWGGRLRLDVDAARRRARATSASALGLDAEATAAAVVALVDAHMTDAVRRVLSLAGADPRRLDLVAFGGMGAVHATTQAAALGMQRVLVPDARRRGSPRSACSTADHVVDAAARLIAAGREVDLDRARRARRRPRGAARAELAAARRRPTIAVLRVAAQPRVPGPDVRPRLPLVVRTAATARRATWRPRVEEFHRRNEAARLIEARAQEPTVRGIRLIATGLVDRPPGLDRLDRSTPASRRRPRRRLHTGDGWHDDVPVYDGARSPRARPSSVPRSSSTRSPRCSCGPATPRRCVRTATCSSVG